MIQRIAWVGPWSQRSAIAQFGTLVVAQLVQRGIAVDILRSETGAEAAEPAYPAPGPIARAIEADPWRVWRDHDAVLVNIGDHYGYHGGAFAFYPHVPVIAILHDSSLVNLLRGAGRDLYPHAAAALRDAEAAQATQPQDGEAGTRTMTGWFAAGAAGAVVHAQHYAARVRAACPGPVAVIPLAYTGPDVPPPRGASDLLNVATIGRLGPNKRADQVIRGIAAVPGGPARIRYRLIGAIVPAERARLETLAGELGVTISFAGEVSDAALVEEFATIDVLACLRHPALEGASASLIVGMLSARPVLVSNQGVYADMPPDAVLFCEAGQEAPDVARHLTAILGDRRAAGRVGERARAYAHAAHDPARYAGALLDFIPTAMEGAASIDAARSLGARLAAIGASPDDPAIARLGEAMADLFGGTTAGPPAMLAP
jgi:glycosyltransferase involved in cell wall biosynthesis